jgi:putative phage-type endonuclease
MLVSQHPIARGELHPLRKTCDLTASEAPAVLGFGYKSVNELLTEKRTGISKPLSFIAQGKCDRGKALEAEACAWLDKRLGKKHSVADFYVRVEMDADFEPVVMGASPDGVYTDGDELIEIKCPETYTDVAPNSRDPNRKATWWQYWLQVQFQLWVTQKQRAVLCVYHPSLPSQVFRIRWIQEFWDQVYWPAIEQFLRHRNSGKPFPRRKAGYREEVYEWVEEL